MLPLLVAFTLRIAAQAPTDPLIFGTGMAVGSRLQYGVNVVPDDWRYQGELREKASTDTGLKGFKIIQVSDPGSSSKPPEGFVQVPCEFDGTTPVLTAFAQSGEKHKLIVDTGALHTYIKPGIAETLNGSDAPFPMVVMLADHKWLHFKTEVDRHVAVLSNPAAGFAEDGILGLNAVSCLQLKIDYRAHKMWARLSSRPMDAKEAGALKPIPMKRLDSGRCTVPVAINGKAAAVEVDTGANILGLNTAAVSDYGLTKVGDGTVVVQQGSAQLSRFLADSASVTDVDFLWPVIHAGPTSDPSLGGFGPSVLPHQTVIIDYPGLRLYTAKPTDDERVEQALGQFIAGIVRFEGKEVVLDMVNILGPARAVLLKVQDRSVADIVADFRALAKGNADAKSRLTTLFKAVSTNGHIVFRQDGMEKTVDISG